jgi:hypothetical protein
MIAPAPLLFCRLAVVAVAMALSISTAEAQWRGGGGAAWRQWVAWWRLAWRWWLGLAWWRLGLVAWVGLGLSHPPLIYGLHQPTIIRRQPTTLAPHTIRHRLPTLLRHIATDTPPVTPAMEVQRTTTVGIQGMACR